MKVIVESGVVWRRRRVPQKPQVEISRDFVCDGILK